MDSTAIRAEINRGIHGFLRGQRIAPDVSVLLAGVLDEESPSGRILNLATEGTIILSAHTETTAIAVLQEKNPSLLGEFGAGLVKLATRCPVERVPSADLSTLGELGKHLSGEDLQVLADALSAKATVLYTHDSDFFKQRIPGLVVLAPGAHAFDYFDFRDLQGHQHDWTFLGLFYPNWSTEALRGTSERFYIFEIAGHVSCYYETKKSEFVLEWRARTRKGTSLRLPHQVVEMRSYNFVSVMCAENSVTLFVNGQTRRTEAKIGPAPATTTFHPFQSHKSTHQIDGVGQFRLVAGTMTERSVRRHRRARTLQLTDGETQWADHVRKVSILT